MGEIITIRGFKRQQGTRGQMRRLRESGLIPAVCYGRGLDGINISLPEPDARRQLGHRNGNTLVQLSIEGETAPRLTLLKEIQRNPIDSRILHLDFQTIELNQAIKAQIPVILQGEGNIAKQGLTVSHQLREIEVECLPGYLPENLPLEVSQLQVGDKIVAADVNLPEQVKLITEPEAVILVVMPPGAAEAPPVETEALPE